MRHLIQQLKAAQIKARKKLHLAIEELAAISKALAAVGEKKPRHISPAGRERIRAAQRKRWRKQRSAK
jgi:hypothetical protein